MKLSYFNVRGLAETSRLLLAIGGEDYTDFRYPLDVVDISVFNFKKDEFDADKADGKLVKSLNKVPFLEVDGEVISQSKAIERFLAKRFGLFGSSDVEVAQIDSICEYVVDFKREYQKVRALEGDAREEGMKVWFGETLVERLQALDVIVGETYSVGGKVSLADVVLYNFLTGFFDNVEGATAATATAPHIQSVVAKVAELDSVKQWLEKRPATNF